VAVACHVRGETPRLTLRWLSKAGCWLQCGGKACGGVLQKKEQLTPKAMENTRACMYDAARSHVQDSSTAVLDMCPG